MSSNSLGSNDRVASSTDLLEWETAVIDLFLNAAQSVGLPKSVGQIYGLLFCRDEPLSMDAIMKCLIISKGSASQGLKALRQLGAVRNVFVPGERREHFVAEIRLRKLVAGFLKEQAEPHLVKGKDRLQSLHQLVAATENEEDALRGKRRASILASWHRQVGKLLPLVKMIVGKAERLPGKSS
ncbi:MAG: hypothetical protein CMI31_13830 [Opitutae bacterium]|nr:hypothetical protein [Opitutae bacterium]